MEYHDTSPSICLMYECIESCCMCELFTRQDFQSKKACCQLSRKLFATTNKFSTCLNFVCFGIWNGTTDNRFILWCRKVGSPKNTRTTYGATFNVCVHCCISSSVRCSVTFMRNITYIQPISHISSSSPSKHWLFKEEDK